MSGAAEHAAGAEPPAVPSPPRRGRTRAKAISWLVGVALIALAAWAAARAGASITSVWATITAAPREKVVLLLALIAATPVTTSLMFWVLQRRYTRLGLGENTILIVSAWLLNFLPLAPGLVGRLAYLKAVYGTPLGHSARAVIWANVLSVVAALGMLALVALCAAAFPASPVVLAGVVFTPALMLGALAWYAKIKRPQPDPEVWRVVAALAIRYAELHLWAARYWTLFEVMNSPIAWGGALALSGVAALAMLFPLAPNGLGLREWGVGLVAPLLPASLVYAVGLSASVGLSADLVHRGCEVLVAVPLGIVATTWVGARLRRSASTDSRA